jgi:cation diffusion facilitator CzcD-associated flavoprotein CzcO
MSRPSPGPTDVATARTRSPRIAIVGAGMSGLGMAMRLVKAGLTDFTLFEKAADLGGTWHHNRYPGIACDVPARFYTYASELHPDWSRFFPGGREICGYFDAVAARYGLREHIRFGEEVLDARWTGSSWAVRTTTGEQGEFDFLVTATGILHHPRKPDIDGLEDFAGPVLHSAEWDDTIELADRRIGVVGNGSTGVQIVSELAEDARRLAVSLRTPQWILPVPNLAYSALGRSVVGRSKRLSTAAHRLYQRVFELTFGVATVRPGWQRTLMSALCRLHLRRVPDPRLRAALTPDYQPLCKRIVMGTGFYRAVQRPNVDVVTEGIERVVPEGVITTDGRTHRLDVLVLATGFDTQAFLRPMTVTGAGGVTLDDAWADAPYAYRSVAVPGFPNLFMLVGPHSPFGNFSVIAIAEAQADYVMQCVELFARGVVETFDPSPAATARFNADVVSRMPGTTWTSRCANWYLDRNGRPNTFPGTPAEHRELLAEPLLDELVAGQRVDAPVGVLR